MKTKRQKLIKDLDTAWSLAVRNRDKICILCENVTDVKKLQAHHWVVPRARSLKYRWNLENGVALCYACHMFKIHATATLDQIEMLKDIALGCDITTPGAIEEIKRSTGITKYSIGELEDILEGFKN